MRWSQAFIPTLRDDPADAEAASHRLLVRAGYVRQLMSGVYSILPLGMRVRTKIAEVIRQEMNRIGGQEFLLPALHPAEMWEASGRREIMGDNMFEFRDRRDARIVLGMTHEEVFANLGLELSSYRDLPQIWYQIQTKFRDEPRPKGAVLRTREFTMKDSYTIDIDDAGLDLGFEKHRGAYRRIFERIGLETIDVEASSGAMGGSDSVEFMAPAAAGEDLVARCVECDYAANLERATSRLEPVEDGPGLDAPEEFATPGIKTIQALAESHGAAPERQIKTMVYIVDGELMLVLLRGDHTLVEQKLIDGLGAIEVRPAQADEVQAALGALPGSLGAVGVEDLRVIADEALRDRRDMTTGANRDDFHLRGVDVARDISIDHWFDLRGVDAGEPCPQCGNPLELFKAIEVGHIFKLGRKYAETFGLTVLDENGETRTITMGSYGIGLERNMAAVVEASHDDKGICWPVPVAPYEVVITVLRAGEGPTLTAGEQLYDALLAAGVDVLLDDRDERPGVKFNDADLIGIPYRITVGPRGLESGVVEVTRRRDGTAEELSPESAAAFVTEQIEAERT